MQSTDAPTRVGVPGAMRKYPSACRPGLLVAFSICLLLAFLTMPGNGLAQTPSPLASWQYSAGEVLVKLDDDPLPEWRVTLGLTGTVMPKYEGADSYHVMPGGI